MDGYKVVEKQALRRDQSGACGQQPKNWKLKYRLSEERRLSQGGTEMQERSIQERKPTNLYENFNDDDDNGNGDDDDSGGDFCG